VVYGFQDDVGRVTDEGGSKPVSDEVQIVRNGRAAPARPSRRAVGLSFVTSEAAAETAGIGTPDAAPTAALVSGDKGRRRLQFLLEGRGWTALHLVTDLLAGMVAVSIVSPLDPGRHPALLAFPFAVVAMLHLRGIYRRRVRLAFLDAAGPLIGAVSVAAMSVLTWEVVVHHDAAAGTAIGQAWALTLVLLGGGRAVLVILQRRARSLGLVGKPTLIVGAGVVGGQVARRLQERSEYGLQPVGFLDDDPLGNGAVSDRTAPVLGSPSELAAIAAETGAQHVILAFSNVPDRGLVPLTRECEELGLEVSLVPRLFESINDRIAVERLGALPLFGLRAIDPKGWQFRIKYAIERPLAALLLVAIAPLMLLTAAVIKLTSPGPAIFRQRRVGRDGQAFDFYKFRSMRLAGDGDAFTPANGKAPGGIEGVDRRTPIGRFLRRTGLDELPQLWNVVKGEMSIVGPRPERPEFVERFIHDHDRYTDRHRVKSGITGWAQVNGLRGQTSLADRIEWDNFYIENWSLWLDFKVLLLTLGAVLRTGDEV
jgi:exopolysaccharide biosynthesis polyprenyl glycosylphosphotransferase